MEQLYKLSTSAAQGLYTVASYLTRTVLIYLYLGRLKGCINTCLMSGVTLMRVTTMVTGGTAGI